MGCVQCCKGQTQDAERGLTEANPNEVAIKDTSRALVKSQHCFYLKVIVATALFSSVVFIGGVVAVV